jgi:nitroreductase
MTVLLNRILGKFWNKFLPVRIALYDWMRLHRFFARQTAKDPENLLSLITCHWHVVEKGLSMKEVRPLFGRDGIANLLNLLNRYRQEGHDPGAFAYQAALQVLAAYMEYHAGLPGIDLVAEPFVSIRNRLKNDGIADNLGGEGFSGGRKYITRAEVLSGTSGTFPELMGSRCSVRHFAEAPVDEADIIKAVQWAQKSPSVCNRQEIRILAINSAEKIQKILLLQGGTRGFAEQVKTLLIVGGDLRAFHSPAERNQVYCDSGIFAMSLLLGLHYLGLGTCPLHWCVDPSKDRQLRELADIPSSCTVAMLIAVGTLPEQFYVAYSQRIPVDAVLLRR